MSVCRLLNVLLSLKPWIDHDDFSIGVKHNHIAVTYDSFITKVAMQIQRQKYPKYDQLFINLGAFNIKLAFSDALGKIVAESGRTYAFQDTEVLAKASIRSYLEGTNYKRCKSFHEVLAVALEVILYEYSWQ